MRTFAAGEFSKSKSLRFQRPGHSECRVSSQKGSELVVLDCGSSTGAYISLRSVCVCLCVCVLTKQKYLDGRDTCL